jgi:putative acetyltransferase
MEIRYETPADADDVRKVNELAFEGLAEARIIESLRGLPGSISMVATTDGRVVAHIFFTPVEIEGAKSSTRVAGLGPMAVLPGQQRAGVGSALVRAGIDACRRQGYAAIVVLGHPAYYPRFGFRPAGRWGLTCEYPAPPEAFMALELDAGALDSQGGLVRYRPEFSE